MLDCTALPHITSHCEDDTPRGQQISSQFLTILSHLDLPNVGMPQFLQVSSAACANSFPTPLGQMCSPGKTVWLGASMCQTHPSCHRGPGSLSAARINWGGSDSCQIQSQQGEYTGAEVVQSQLPASAHWHVPGTAQCIQGTRFSTHNSPMRQITPMVLQLQVLPHGRWDTGEPKLSDRSVHAITFTFTPGWLH